MSQDNLTVVSDAIGIDLGDKECHVCHLDAAGTVAERSTLPTTEVAFRRKFGALPRTRIAIEVGTHSPWLSRLLGELGHEVIVANARKLRLIYENPKKNDRVDAEQLARVARMDPQLLHPVTHVGERAQADRAMLRARDALVRVRGVLVNQARGLVKSMGTRLPKCSTDAFPQKAIGHIPDLLKPALTPLLEAIKEITCKIRAYDRDLDQLVERSYPLAARLTQVQGVGNLTALAFMLTIEDPARFKKSREVGAYLGLTPRKNQSGDSDPELGITKAGNSFVRRLLVQSAQYILGAFGPKTDLRLWGLSVAARGRKASKKRAVVAVARKLAVLLHRLWGSPAPYEPNRRAG